MPATAPHDLAEAIATVRPTLAPLLDAARAIATLANPERDLCELSGDLREIAVTLEFVATGLSKAYLDSIECETKYRLAALEAKARDTAVRTAKRALIDLASWIGSIEAPIAGAS